MALTSQHITGFAVGLGVAAVGFYMYKQNESEVDEWLRRQGINLPSAAIKDYSAFSLEELVLEKERLEDMIAERELAAHESESQPESGTATEPEN